MKTSLRILFLAALMVPLVSCSGGESDSADDASTTVSEVNAATDAVAATVTETLEAAVEAICCEGASCDAPAGTCCSDGTCNGAHRKLPLAP